MTINANGEMVSYYRIFGEGGDTLNGILCKKGKVLKQMTRYYYKHITL